MSPTLVTTTNRIVQFEYLARILCCSLLISIQSAITFASSSMLLQENNVRLFKAAGDGKSKEVELLLKAGADKEALDKNGLAPLHRAVQNGHGAVVDILLKAGAYKDAVDKDGWTPLHWAAHKGHEAVAAILLKAGATKDAVTRGCTVTKAGWTPLHVAANYGQKAVVEILLSAGAKKDAVDVYDMTPLHVAALCGKVSVVKILLTAGANKEAVDKDDRTPLHLAARHGHGHVAWELLNAGVNKDKVGKDGCTPLHLAAEQRYADEVVELLLRAGAHFEYEDNSGKTPLVKAFAAYQKSNKQRLNPYLSPFIDDNNNQMQSVIHMLLLMERGDVASFSLETLKLLQQNTYDPSPFEALLIKSNKRARKHYQAWGAVLENQGIPKVIALLILEYYKGADIRISLFKKASSSSSRERFFPPPLSSSSEQLIAP